ncbi:hypothetical protein ACFQ77_16000 [Streptomyces virginiae]|uniref:hypothetical protein n=1 Tax=Streptomyces virginiae TaxID=1961 RepID=UPI0036B8F12A
MEQLKVHPATHSQMVSHVVDILPEPEAALLAGSRLRPRPVARMHFWKQAAGAALVGRLVDATLRALTAPRSVSPSSASRLWVPRWRAARAPLHHHSHRGSRRAGPGAKHQLVVVDRLLATLVHLRHGATHDVLSRSMAESADASRPITSDGAV